jgi:membrane protease YdiL (CAAX protease family)
MLAAVLIGGAAWYVNLRLVAALAPILPHHDGPLAQVIATPPILPTLVSVAVIPALCEELLFRGVLTRALAPRTGRVVAIALTAALFALYHLSLVQLVPVFILGLWLGALGIGTGSLWPAVVAHALNNGLAILIARGELAPLADALAAHPTVGLAIAGTLVASGVALTIALGRQGDARPAPAPPVAM